MADKSSKKLLQEAEAALEAAVEENKRVHFFCSQRLGEVAHEMKNTLNSIMGFSELLKNEQFGPHSEPHYKEYAAFIHEAAQHLLEVCQREITESKNQNILHIPPPPIQKIDVDVGNVIETTITGLTALAKNLDVELKMQIDDDFPILRTDPVRLRQVLHNLVSNAIKFTPKGGNVNVKATVDRDGSAFILVVKDNGSGIPAEDVLKIMEPYTQSEDMESRGDQGIGLGLTIVKRLVEEMGAELEFLSRKNIGTMVSIKFPMQEN